MKMVLKSVFFLTVEWLGVNAYFRWRNKGRIKTLLFHSISSPGKFFQNAISDDSFIRGLHYLSNNYSILKVNQSGEFSGYDPKKINVLLTFDDGFIDNYALAAPILARFKMSAVFFVIAECLPVGRPPSFITNKLGEYFRLEAYKTFTTVQAQELLAMGMTIGSHGNRHLDYSKLSVEAGLEDADESKKVIEAELNEPIQSFAFPWGKYRDHQLNSLSHAYRRIFTTEHGFNSIDDFVFHRNEVASYRHLCCAASGALDFFSKLFRRH